MGRVQVYDFNPRVTGSEQRADARWPGESAQRTEWVMDGAIRQSLPSKTPIAVVSLADWEVMIDQANPRVHLSVRAESKNGKRLNPRKTDLHRWRETFATKLRGCGIAAEATRKAMCGPEPEGHAAVANGGEGGRTTSHVEP